MSHGATPNHVGKQPKVSEEALNNIRLIIREGLDVLGHSSDLYVGRELKGMWTEKDKGMSFYRLTVEAEDLVNGYIVFCRSEQRRSFKLVVCDADGKVMFTEDSRRNCSEASMYFTNIDTYLQFPVFHPEGAAATPVPGASLFDTVQSSPSFAVPADECDTALGVFGALDGIKPSKKTIAPGKYLLCVLSTGQASLRGGGAYTLSMPIARRPKEAVVRELVQADTEVFKSRAVLQELKTGYLKAKAEYVEWLQRAAEEEERVAGLLERKDRCYANFVDESLKASNLPVRPHVLHPRGAGSSSAAAWLTRQITLGKSAVSALLRSPSSSAPATPQQQQRPVSSPNGMGHGGGSSQYSTPVKAHSGDPSPTPSSTGGKGKILARYVYTEGEEEGGEGAAAAGAGGAGGASATGAGAGAGSVLAASGPSHNAEPAEEAVSTGAGASGPAEERVTAHLAPHSPLAAASQPSPQPSPQPQSANSYSRVLDIYGSDEETEGATPGAFEPSANRLLATEPAGAVGGVQQPQQPQQPPHRESEPPSKSAVPTSPSPQSQPSPAQSQSQSQSQSSATKGYSRVLDIYGSDSDTEKDPATAVQSAAAPEVSADSADGGPSLAARLFGPSDVRQKEEEEASAVAHSAETTSSAPAFDESGAVAPPEPHVASDNQQDQQESSWPAQGQVSDTQDQDFTATQPAAQPVLVEEAVIDTGFSLSAPGESGEAFPTDPPGGERSPKHVHWPSGSPVASGGADPSADSANVEEPLPAAALVLDVDEPLPDQELHAAVVVEGDVYPVSPLPEHPAQIQIEEQPKVEETVAATGPATLHVEVPETEAEIGSQVAEVREETVGEPVTPLSEDATPREESLPAVSGQSPKTGAGGKGGGKKKKGKGKGKKAPSSAATPPGAAVEADEGEEEGEAEATVGAKSALPPASPPSKEPETDTIANSEPSASPSPPRLSPEEEAARLAALSEELLLEPMPTPEYQRELPQGHAGLKGSSKAPADAAGEVAASGGDGALAGSAQVTQATTEPSDLAAVPNIGAQEGAVNDSQATPAYAELPSPVKSTDSSSPRGEGSSPTSAAAAAAPMLASSPIMSPGGYVSPMKPTGAIAGYGVNGYSVHGRPQSAPALSPAPQPQPAHKEPEAQPQQLQQQQPPPSRGLPAVRAVSATATASSNGQSSITGETDSTGTGTGLARVAGYRHSTGTIKANRRYLEMPDPFAGW